MSLRAQEPPLPPAEMPLGSEWRDQFIRDAHILVAEGFHPLEPASLVEKAEPDISGLIVRNARAWLNLPSAPMWATRYFVVEEKHQDHSVREGMARPRIDIHVESNERRPRPVFVFEAKRFYQPKSADQYVGPPGLEALRSGYYMPGVFAAGMLGYVQVGTVAESIQKVHDNLVRERVAHGLAPSGPVWVRETLDSRLGTTYHSDHSRPTHGPLAVYHSFLRCA